MNKFWRNSNLEHNLSISEMVIFNTKWRLWIPQQLVHEKFYVHEQILRAQNCRRKFIENLLSEKRKENIKPNNRDWKIW